MMRILGSSDLAATCVADLLQRLHSQNKLRFGCREQKPMNALVMILLRVPIDAQTDSYALSERESSPCCPRPEASVRGCGASMDKIQAPALQILEVCVGDTCISA